MGYYFLSKIFQIHRRCFKVIGFLLRSLFYLPFCFAHFINKLCEGLPDDDEWFTPNNGYQYRLTFLRKTWHEAREECQSYGGDLAYEGLRNDLELFR